jgi:hypothetical protein
MVPFGITGIIADQAYLKGYKTGQMIYAAFAKFLFPFEREILVAQALWKIRNKIFDDETYILLKDALKYDPYSAEMLLIYVQYEHNLHNKNEEQIAFNKLKRISPHHPMMKELLEKGY